MSWNVQVGVSWKTDRHPVSLFLQTLQAFTLSNHYGAITSCGVYENRLSAIRAELQPDQDSNESISVDTIEGMVTKWLKEDGRNIAIRCGWIAPNRYFTDPPDMKPINRPYYVGITVMGPDFNDGLHGETRQHIFNTIVDAGDHKYFTPSLRQIAATMNVHALLTELKLFLALGAESLLGLNRDCSLTSDSGFLRYHKQVSDYASDIHSLVKVSAHTRPFALDDLMLAISKSTDTCCQSSNYGPILYSSDFAGGSLKQFYVSLAATVQ